MLNGSLIKPRGCSFTYIFAPLFIVENYIFSSLCSPASHYTRLYMESDYIPNVHRDLNSLYYRTPFLHGARDGLRFVCVCVCVLANAHRWPIIITHSKHNYDHFFYIVISLSINVRWCGHSSVCAHKTFPGSLACPQPTPSHGAIRAILSFPFGVSRER